MKTECCGYEWSPETSQMPYPVMWNEFNQVVQCHNCGEVFVPTSKNQEAFQRGQEYAMKWVSNECKRNTERLTSETIDRLSPGSGKPR